MLDIERGKLDNIRRLAWQTDTSVSIHSWGYVRNDEYRDAKSLIDELVDVVSKNGNLLLNVGPKTDGTIPEQVQRILLEIGAWLKTNGEAIYCTRPWLLYGEGPTKVASSAMNSDRQEYTSQDIRFTMHEDTLYAVALGWPENGKLRVHSLWKGTPYLRGSVCSVQLLGANDQLTWEQRDDGLYLNLPKMKPDEPAFAFRITQPADGSHACSR